MKNSIICSILFVFITLQGAMAGKLEQSVKAFYAAVDAGDFEKASSYLAPDVKVYMPFSPEPLNKEAYKMLGMGFKAGFPDMQHKILETSETANTAAFKGSFLGTNTASLQGNPPTGNRVQTPFLGYVKFDKVGKITEVNIQFDLASFNQQLMAGLPPMPNKAAELTNTFFTKVVGGQHDVTLLNDLLAPNFTSNSFPVPNANRDQFIAGIKGLLEGFPDVYDVIIHQFNSDNKVFTYAYWEGTNTGSFMGMPATGKKVRVEFMDIWTEQDGKIVRNEVVMDIAGLMAQLSSDNSLANKQLVSNIMTELNARNLDKVIKNYASDARFHGWTPQGLDVNGYKEAMTELLNAFPDSKFPVLDIIAEGDKVVARHQFEGTHTGKAFQGIPISNKKAYAPATATFRIQNGKVAEVWLNADFMGLMAQLSADTAMKK